MIEIRFADIFDADVDAIVNPANSYMLHGGGLAGLIAHRGGSAMVRESRAQVPVDTGSAIHTGPGELTQFKGIIHTVGPVWEGDEDAPYWRRNSSDEDPDDLLARAHFAAIKVAWEHGYSSVAFPAVSCGVFRFPVKRAAPIALAAVTKALREYSPPVKRVVFCLLDHDHHEAFMDALKAREESHGEAGTRAS